MPRGGTRICTNAAKAYAYAAPLQKRAIFDQAMGHLGPVNVAPIANKAWKDRPWGTMRETRDMVGAWMGSAEQGPAFSLNSDSKAVTLKKWGGSASWPFVLFNFDNRLFTSRTYRMLVDLHKEGRLPHVSSEDLAKFEVGCRFFSALHAFYTTIVCGKRAYDIAYEVAADIAYHQDRQKMGELLQDYDPVTGMFRRPISRKLYESPERLAQIKALGAKPNTWNTIEGGNVWRSKKQRSLDLASKIKDVISLSTSTCIPNAMLFTAHAGTPLFTAGMATGAIGHGLAAFNNWSRALVQGNAMNNIEAARRQELRYALKGGKVANASTHFLLKSAADRMLQERAYQARIFFWQGCMYALSSSSLATGMCTGGITYIILSLGSAIGIAASTGCTTAFNLMHSRTLAKRRQAGQIMHETYKQMVDGMSEEMQAAYFEQFCSKKEHIGVMERHLLDCLRGTDANKAQAAYEFFRTCGISNRTIKTMQLIEPAAKALAVMQKQMYSERTHFYAKNLKMTGYTLGYCTGITYMHRAYRAKHPGTEVEPTVEESVEHGQPIGTVGRVTYYDDGERSTPSSEQSTSTSSGPAYEPTGKQYQEEQNLPPVLIRTKRSNVPIIPSFTLKLF